MCGHVKIVVQLLELLVAQIRAFSFQCRRHGSEPGVARRAIDAKWGVAHSKSRMSALLGVTSRTTPVLLQEHLEMSLRIAQVLGVHRAKEFVMFDCGVEVLNEALKERVTTDLAVKRRFHSSTLMACPRLFRVSCETRGCSSMVELQPSKLAMRVRSPSPALTLFEWNLYQPLCHRTTEHVIIGTTFHGVPFLRSERFALHTGPWNWFKLNTALEIPEIVFQPL
jgi:hypothetical protein